ncbi:TetR/AcrR family transcriptional regulator [Myceligenerans indicum]|uniref:TetR/AcrR family transcriptional regulator n=1 Tax=Myceligenerans indicum TaxID=2593663 RepID=A0ABS1LJ12_9MICO|nr:TetR/AcrR family transcriptional regulator [Myceligenerans indicum]MBL0886186.1 TetR/AcrR family transcriptional regulator [Myceligenerans indicum]
MPALRSDAARSRARILDVARRRDLADLRFNDLAREAGVGVGTVYRHFPTTHALVEALVFDTLDRLRGLVGQAVAERDPQAALADLLAAALDLQLEEGGLQQVLLAGDAEDDDVRAATREIRDGFEQILARARDAGVVRPDLTAGQIEHLVCGVEHAVRLGSAADRGTFLQILLDGLRPVHAGG